MTDIPRRAQEERGWMAVVMEDDYPHPGATVHVVPINDLIGHDTTDDATCVCGVDVATPTRTTAYVVHHALDQRELQEPDHAALSDPATEMGPDRG